MEQYFTSIPPKSLHRGSRESKGAIWDEEEGASERRQLVQLR